jgi:hypothetical protein
LIERAPVYSYADGFVVFHRDFDQRLEILVVVLAGPDVAGVDAVFGKRPGALGILFQKDVPVIVKVADNRETTPRSPSRSAICGTAAAA